MVSDNILVGLGSSSVEYLSSASDVLASSSANLGSNFLVAKPHSSLLSFISAYGLIGLFSAYFFLSRLFKKSHCSVNKPFLFAILVSSLVTDHFFSPLCFFLSLPLVFDYSTTSRPIPLTI